MIYYHLDLYKAFDKKIEKKFNSVNYDRWLLTVGVGICSSADICKRIMAGKLCRQETDVLNMI